MCQKSIIFADISSPDNNYTLMSIFSPDVDDEQFDDEDYLDGEEYLGDRDDYLDEEPIYGDEDSSPMSWERQPGESDEDYEERMDDYEGLV